MQAATRRSLYAPKCHPFHEAPYAYSGAQGVSLVKYVRLCLTPQGAWCGPMQSTCFSGPRPQHACLKHRVRL